MQAYRPTHLQALRGFTCLWAHKLTGLQVNQIISLQANNTTSLQAAL